MGWRQGLLGRGRERREDCRRGSAEGSAGSGRWGEELLREPVWRGEQCSAFSPGDPSCEGDAYLGEDACAERDASASGDAPPGERATAGGASGKAQTRRVARAIDRD